MDSNIPKKIDAADRQALEAILVQFRSKYELYPKHPRQSDFERLADSRNRFNIQSALEILSDKESLHTPLKWVLAAGVCGWIIDPTDNAISIMLMFLESERILEECVAYASATNLDSIDLEEIVGKYVFIGEGFNDDIRLPLGGFSPHEFMSSGADLEYEVQQEMASVNSLNFCLLTLHIMGDLHAAGRGRLRPSWNLVRHFAAKNRDKSAPANSTPKFQSHYADTRLREVWSKYAPAFSMLYSANYVQIDHDRTLLKMIFSTHLDTRLLLEALPDWLSKSAYFYANYLKPLENTGQSRVGAWLVKNYDQQKFDAKPTRTISIRFIQDILNKGVKTDS